MNPGRRDGAPFGLGAFVEDKPLPLPFTVRAQMRGWQGHVMVDLGDMLGGHADLDHFDAVRGFQHAVADFGRLDKAIARIRRIGPP